MKLAMMWYDNSPTATLENKIQGAVTYYQKKYSDRPAPDLCFIHPSMMPVNQNGNKLELAGVEVRSTKSVMPNHFWIGRE